MSRKSIAIIAEIIPVVSAVVSFVLIMSAPDSQLIRQVILVTIVLAFLGFAFFLTGRKLARGDRTVRFLGVLDCIATAYVIGLYTLAIFSFGL